jgi:uncharacterized protein YndB with AHSA1/START domain
MTTAVHHTSFVIERKLAASPSHAFRFWSDADLKARWTSCHPDWTLEENIFDFRVGGQDRMRWRTSEGAIQTYDAHYFDIIPGHRILYAYDMSFGGSRLSASLVTIELVAVGEKCRMIFTEQVAMLAGGVEARQQRLLGTEQGIDLLCEILQADAA